MGTRFSARPDRSWGSPSLLYNGYRVFPGGKVRPERAADHSPPSSAAVMEEYSCTSTHPLGHTGPVTASLYILLFPSIPTNGVCIGSNFAVLEVFHDPYSSPNIILVMKWRRMRWTRQVALWSWGAHRVWVGKDTWKVPLGWQRHRWDDNVRISIV